MESQDQNSNPSNEGTKDKVEVPRARCEWLSLIRQFQRLNLPSFEGATEPATAEEWVRRLEKIFKVLKCTDQQRVEIAVFMLRMLYQRYLQMMIVPHVKVSFITY